MPRPALAGLVGGSQTVAGTRRRSSVLGSGRKEKPGEPRSSFQKRPRHTLAGARDMKPDTETMIVELRSELSVQEIATRAGLSRVHVYRLAAGDVRRPSF